MATPPRRILVPTDFSPTAGVALDLARQLAVAFGAEVHLLHVRILLDDPNQEEELQAELERLMNRSDQRTRELLGRTRDTVTEVVVHPHLVRGIAPAESVVEAVGDLGCDLVVMGTHGRRGLKHLLMGSVAEEVTRTSPVPVLTVRSDSTAEPASPKRILVPLDFSETSMAAVTTAAVWARALHASVTLLHVVEPVVYPEFYAVDLMPEDVMDRIRERSAQALDRIAAENLADIETSVRVAVGRAPEVILEEAGRGGHDLVILASRGLSPLEHLLLGSVADGVIRRSTAPVLTVRPEA